MQEIIEYQSFLIRFYSNEDLPIRVHVQKEDREMNVEYLFLEKGTKILFEKVKGKEPLSLKEAKKIGSFLKKYAIIY